MPNTHTTLTSLFEDIADSIRGKTGDSADIVADDFPSAIDDIPTGSGVVQPLTVTENGTYTASGGVDGYSPVTVSVSGGVEEPEEGVIFIDYDGTLIETWEPDEIASKTALPANPSHDRLVAEGWNWTLSDIQDYAEDMPNSLIIVGQLYHTVSGHNEFDITLTKATGLEVSFLLDCVKDWGDGTSSSEKTHTYPDYGSYTIVTSDNRLNDYVFGQTGSSSPNFTCTAIRLGGRSGSFSSGCLKYLFSLRTLSVPSDFYYFSEWDVVGYSPLLKCIILPAISSSYEFSNAFEYCYSLRYVSLPCRYIKEINNYAFIRTSVKFITLPYPDNTFTTKEACFSYSPLKKLIFPSDVDFIDRTFSDCYFLELLDLSRASRVSSLASSLSSYISPFLDIKVPPELYFQWKRATNWVIYANNISTSVTFTTIKSLSIVADDCSGRNTKTTIHYTAVWNTEEGIEVTENGDAYSNSFPQNTSTTDTVQRTVTFTYEGLTASDTITQGVWVDGLYTLEGVGSFPFTELSQTVPNPDSTLYDGVYQSTNKNVDSSQSVVKISFVGYENFTVYIRSYAESNYDYTIASVLDSDSYPTSYNDQTALASTRGKQKSGTSISDYIKVEYPNDGGEHFIYIVFRKDSSSHEGDDRGYFLIEK